MISRKWKFMATFFVFWLMIISYMAVTMMQTPQDAETEFKLKQAMEQLEAMKTQNFELKQMINNVRKRQLDSGAKTNEREDTIKKHMVDQQAISNMDTKLTENDIFKSGPGKDHETLRRKIDNGVTEFWFYIRSKLKHIKKASAGNPEIMETVDVALEDGGEQERSIITDVHHLRNTDGAATWRAQEAKELSDIVQRRLHYLQNPKDCKTAKKVVCNLNKGCGYGCQLHHAVYCFILAYGTQRTMILESSGWRYNPGGWEKVFKPLSDTCLSASGASHGAWGRPEAIKNVQVVSLPIVDSLRPRPDYMPLAIPEDLAPRLLRLHGDPPVWWLGQFVKYMLKPQPALQARIAETTKRLGFKTPIVGVHVRRTDKVGTEASFHGIDEYMAHVKEYYDLLERREKVDKRRVFLASDEPKVLINAKAKYPNYEFISDPQISKSAGMGTRYTDSSLYGVILDIHFLSISNFLVCTFSSQVCRVAYEIMQGLHPDASSYFRSLDDIHYFGGQNGHQETAIYEHKPRDANEIALLPGNEVLIAGNHWDGYSKGTNLKAGSRKGLYPSYKTVNKFRIVKMPTYPEADVQS